MAIDTQDPEFESMITNPKFMKLTRPQQIQLVTEFKQQKRMITPKPEGFLQNALKVVGDISHKVNIGTDAMVNTATFGAARPMGKLIDKGISALIPPPQNPNPQQQEMMARGEKLMNPRPELSPGEGIGGFMSMMTNPVKYNENIIEGLGSALGFMGGGPGSVYQGTEKAIAGVAPGILRSAGARAVAGGASGFSAPGDLGERARMAGAGALLAPVLGAGTDLAGGAIRKIGGFAKDLKGAEIPSIKGKIATAEGDIVATQQKVNDLVKLGPEKIKGKAQEIYKGFQKDFGEGLGNLKWNMNGGQFEEAFQNAARDLGGWQNPGSPGARMMELADSFKGQRLKAFSPKDVQSMVKQITGGMDQNSAIRFYKQFGEVLARDYPEFAALKEAYAPVFDILKTAKVPKSGVFREVASDKIGPEGLARAAEAEQIVGVEPSLLGQASEQGSRLRGRTEEAKALKSQLQQMINKQSGAKKSLQKFMWQTAANAVPVGGGLLIAKNIFK
jgi:hypothetical protein